MLGWGVNTLNPGLLTPCLPSVLPGFLQSLSTCGEEPPWETVAEAGAGRCQGQSGSH